MNNRFIILTVDYPPMPAGMAQHCHDIALALKLNGDCPEVIAPALPSKLPSRGYGDVKVIRLKTVRQEQIFDHYISSLCAYIWACLLSIRRGKPQAVIANTWSIAGVAAWAVKKLTGIPYFICAHGLDINASRTDRKVLLLMRMVLGGAASVIANSSFTAELARTAAPGISPRIVHPAIDSSRLEERQVVGNIPGIFSGRRILLTVSRLVRSKGHADVIKCLPAIIAEFPDILYCIVGEGPENDALHSLVCELKVDRYVFFAGNVSADDLPAYYRSCEIFILCSKHIPQTGEVEGFGIVFLEAAFFAKPCIAARTGGIVDAVIDGETGVLIEPSDTAGLTACLKELLSDKERRSALGRNARERVLSEFNIGRFAGQLKGVINEGLAARP